MSMIVAAIARRAGSGPRLLSVVLAGAACAGCAAAPGDPAPLQATAAVDTTSAAASSVAASSSVVRARPEIYAPFTLTADLAALTPDERRMLALFMDAAAIMDGLFWQQAYGDRDRLLAGLGDPVLRRFAEINYGPWDRLDDNKPFVPGVGPKPQGAAFYPPDMSREEFERAELPGKTGLYTFITRDGQGALALVPYRVRFATELRRAAALLEEAAALSSGSGAAQLPEIACGCPHER